MKKLILTAATMLMLTVPAIADNGITVFSNGNEVADKGIIIDGRTMVPVRGVFEYLGYNVEWDSNTKTAILTNNEEETVITLTNGENTFTVNDKEITPDVPQQIVNSRFLLPLRAIGEASGKAVDWDADTKTAYIGNNSTVESNSNNIANTVKPSIVEKDTTKDNSKFELIDNGDGSFTIPGVKIEIVDEADLGDNATEIVVE